MVLEEHQGHLDAYMQGEIGEAEFLDRIQYRRTWNFDWENYRPLFETARRFSAHVVGVNHRVPPGRSSLRQRDEATAEETARSQDLSIVARQAYLRYRFNPGSAALLGLHEASVGDRRGKVFSGIGPGVLFDCKVGTWCMPFGAVGLGAGKSDFLFHWALQYTAWDDREKPLPDTLDVEIFRIFYAEHNIPLGRNRGPGLYNPQQPDNPAAVDPSQMVDSQGNPIYYNARDQEYIGMRVNWLGGPMFVNMDITSNQGPRVLRRYRPSEGKTALDMGGEEDFEFKQKVSGYVWEAELGYRWAKGRTGLRFMDASGDGLLADGDKAGLTKSMKGYYEVTPGTYQGTRLYFNGHGSALGSGDGLGHSVNNTQFYGLFVDYSDPGVDQMEYRMGLYKLSLNNPIYAADGSQTHDIGLELDNLMGFYIHKALKLQFEANFIRPGKAFRLDDYSTPDKKTRTFSQGIIRLLYEF